ncbi:protein FlbA (plasmid) [Maritalea myrionectae]|uniref:Protein FlbA n=1 Tax=Maritalea myrionectae TaxID=454601 RepID=A0A2R4MJD8_9HYPH|nr:protein FlbA [Maritalea myrionectae]
MPSTTTLPELLKAVDATVGNQKYEAAVRLVTLAPTTSVFSASSQIFDILKKTDLLSLFARYYSRLPERYQQSEQIRAYCALCSYYAGDNATAIPSIHRTLLSTNGYTISGAALDIFSKNVDLRAIFASAMEEIKASRANMDTIVFAFLIALHKKYFEDLEVLMEITTATPLSSQNPLLLYQSARAARALGALERAAELIFAANNILPDDGMIASLAVDIGRQCPSDRWVSPAIDVAEKARLQIKNPEIVQRVVVSLARLYVRSNNPLNALAQLEKLAKHENTHPASVRAIARSQMLLGETSTAFLTLKRFAESNNPTAEILYDMVGTLAAQNKVPEAIELMQKSFADANMTVEASAIIGHIYAWAGEIKLALPWLKSVLIKSPNHASAFADLSLCTEFDRDYTLALTLADFASSRFLLRGPPQILGIEFMHQARLRRRMMFLADMVGDMKKARALQRESIAKAPIVLPYPIHEWPCRILTGNPDLTGKSVMVLSDMGIGDEIRYTSVLHNIVRDARKTTLSCDPRLESLLARSFPEVNVIPVLRDFPGILNKRMDNRKLAVNEPMRKIMSDTLIQRGRKADIWVRGRHYFEAQCIDRSRVFQSPTKPVLKPDPTLKQKFLRELEARTNGRRVVGLSWRGGRRTYNREPHYFELSQWLPLLDNPNLCFVNLQYALRADELEFLRTTLGERFIEFPELDLFDDIEGVAALSNCLDLVVSICTAVLELACSVGTHTLYLMRSPQVTHAIRLSGLPDLNGAYQDAVWHSCRIIPRFDMRDSDLIAQGRDYITDYFQQVDKP